MRVRFRLTPRQVAIQAGAIGFLWLAMVLFNLRFGRVSAVVLAAYGVVFLGSVVLSARWRGLELGPEGATVRRNAKRFVPWAEVTQVRDGSLLLTRVVVLETARGPVRSWAPAASPLAPDRDFEAKLDYIRRWWWAARSEAGDAVPVQPVGRATGWGVPVVSEADASAAVRR